MFLNRQFDSYINNTTIDITDYITEDDLFKLSKEDQQTIKKKILTKEFLKGSFESIILPWFYCTSSASENFGYRKLPDGNMYAISGGSSWNTFPNLESAQISILNISGLI